MYSNGGGRDFLRTILIMDSDIIILSTDTFVSRISKSLEKNPLSLTCFFLLKACAYG